MDRCNIVPRRRTGCHQRRRRRRRQRRQRRQRRYVTRRQHTETVRIDHKEQK